MKSCKHDVLTLVKTKNNKLRCRHCHLTITEDELGRSCCPECLETHKISRRDFERITEEQSKNTRYCCDSCGMVVEY